MAYTIKRSGHIKDEVTVEDNGKTLTIKVDLTVDDILANYNQALRAIQEASTTAEKARADRDPEAIGAASEALGRGVISLFGMLFGVDQTQEILTFYENRYTEMLADFLPYITQVIMPKIQEAKDNLAKRYKSWR